MNIFLLFTILSFVFSFSSSPVQAQELVAGGSATLKSTQEQKTDERVNKLQGYLAEHRSPLEPHAADMVAAADLYNLDWKLLPAITGVESTFGKHIPFNSFNAYGWNNGNFRFESWEQSINHVSRALKEKYVDRGLDTPWKIGRVYAPPSSTWASKVSFFMDQIENFGKISLLETPVLTI